MAIVVGVSLISGKNVSLEAGLDASVGSLKESARRPLGVGIGRLFSSSGCLVDEDATVEAVGLTTGDCLTLQISKVQMGACRGNRCFAAMLGDGCVVTWGCAEAGGSSDAVRDQLKSMQQIPVNGAAFVAILSDGSVCIWGDQNMVATAVLCSTS